MIHIGGGLRVHEGRRCRRCGAGVDRLSYYDGALGFEAIQCAECGHQEDLNKPDKEGDTFFTQLNCDRCGRPLEKGRTMSWFTKECICGDCSDKERELRQQLRREGRDDAQLEGCGYVPAVGFTR